MIKMREHNNRMEQDEGTMVYGTRAVLEAIRSGKEIERLFIQAGLNNPLLRELRHEMKEAGILFQMVPIEKLNRLTRSNHQGVIGIISSITYFQTDQIVPQLFEKGLVPLLLILDRITDTRNLGAIARTAECAGANAIIIPSRGSALINSDAIKTSAGALHHLPVCRENNLKDTIDYLKESGIRIVACSEKTDHFIEENDFKTPTAIIMGSEENGVSSEYIKRADAVVKIPMAGQIASYNVSVAAGIVLYEALRQRNK
jgi:23S rRNA (guanosine2251-2'-O)-methyltransferase